MSVVAATSAPAAGAGASTGTSTTAAAVTNLLTGSQATFDLGAGGWLGAAATASQVATPSQSGPGALALTSTIGAVEMATVQGAGTAGWTPAAPGQVYTATAWVRAATTARRADAMVAFRSATGASLGSAWGPLGTDQAAAWGQTGPAVGIAPAGTAYAETAVFFYGAATGETHYVDTVALTTHPGGSAAIAGPLHTSGNRIYDANDQLVTLRGTASELLDWNPAAPPGSQLDDNNIAHMKQWGDNVVRVLLSENYWDSNDCAYAPGYAGAVDQVVNSITSRGMVAILSLHNNSTTPCGPSGQYRMADAPGSITFWQSVASRFKSNPLVAFDLFNEPYGITWDQWLNGGPLVGAYGVTWQAAGMRQMYDAVRQTGAGNLVFVSGNNWANDPPSGTYLLGGPNVVYAAHAYTCPSSAPPNCASPDPYNVPAFLRAWAPLAATDPVMVTEFGWPDPGGSAYVQSVINWAESLNIGWTAYGWYSGGAYGAPGGHFGILADTITFQPEASGMPVLAGLGRNSS
jgi:endoglucanase